MLGKKCHNSGCIKSMDRSIASFSILVRLQAIEFVAFKDCLYDGCGHRRLHECGLVRTYPTLSFVALLTTLWCLLCASLKTLGIIENHATCTEL